MQPFGEMLNLPIHNFLNHLRLGQTQPHGMNKRYWTGLKHAKLSGLPNGYASILPDNTASNR